MYQVIIIVTYQPELTVDLKIEVNHDLTQRKEVVLHCSDHWISKDHLKRIESKEN